MRKFSNAAAAFQSAALNIASDLNFYSKRKRDTRLECAEDILAELVKDHGLTGEFEAADLVSWLQDNKPVKQAATRQAVNKPSADTMIGQQQSRLDDLPILAGQAFVITAAQNNTTVNADCLEALKGVAENIGAQLVVLPVYYNKNAFSAVKESEAERFDDALADYLLLQDSFLFSNTAVKLAAEAAILPTAKLPVNAAKQLNSGEGLTIVASPKQQVEMMPMLPDTGIRAGVSTGVCTDYNYIRGRAGSEAETDHTFGGLVVYKTGTGTQFVNLQYREGRIEYVIPTDSSGDIYQDIYSPSAMKLGDLHCEMFDPKCWNTTIQLLRQIRPDFVAVEDVLHFSSRSHHNRHSGKHLYSAQGQTVLAELNQVIRQLNQLAQIVPDVYVTESNHNSALDVWLDDKTYSPKTDPVNAKLYYLINWAVCEAIDSDQDSAVALELAIQLESQLSGLEPLADNIRFGRGHLSEVQNGCEMSQHGHKGQNGSFGSPKLFSKWGTVLATGHTHSPALIGRVVTAGVTARKDQGYNRLGASSWAQADAIIFSNGAQQLIFKEEFPA